MGAIAGAVVAGLIAKAMEDSGSGASGTPSHSETRPTYPLTDGRGSDQIYDTFMKTLSSMNPKKLSLGSIGYAGLPGFAKPLYDMRASELITKQSALLEQLLGQLIGATSSTSDGATPGWGPGVGAAIGEGAKNIDWANLFSPSTSADANAQGLYPV